MDALFSADKDGAYFCCDGYNPKVVIAFLPAAAMAAVLALVPAFDALAPFSWIFGTGVSGALYALVSRRGRVPSGAGPLPQDIIASQVSRAARGEDGAEERTVPAGEPVAAEGS
ncbi:hypothetical protein [Streptomyces sp. NPDC048644]|uniref:hypothetical protein n=1 Tax=Streptomyces sp. NPDC048644 TaxID=3365582 RepID=UPI00371FE929